MWDKALNLAGQDPDFHRKDLYEAISQGVFPAWKLGIQTLKESQENDFDFDILDATKVWPEELVPIRYIELNRNVDEYFTQTEQVAFPTGHVIPGIGFSDDALLQGRNFSYFDTQISRLGIDWEELPINRTVCPVMNQNRDGPKRHTITKGKANYWPNRWESAPPAKPSEGGYVDYPENVAGVKTRLKFQKFKDRVSRAQLFWNYQSPPEKMHLISALAFELDHCDDPLVYDKMAEHLCDIDLELAQAVAEKAGAPTLTKQGKPNAGKKSAGLSITAYNAPKPTIASRRVAILIGDGYDPIAFNGVYAALKAAKPSPSLSAPTARLCLQKARARVLTFLDQAIRKTLQLGYCKISCKSRKL